MRDDAAFFVDDELVAQDTWEAALPLDIPLFPTPRGHALLRAEIATSLDELVPVELTFVDDEGEQEFRLWLSHRSSFPLTSDFIEGVPLGDRGEILGQRASISYGGAFYRQYLLEGCGLGLGFLARDADDPSRDLNWLTLRALAVRAATDVCSTSDGPRPALSRYPGLFVVDRQRVTGVRWLSEAPPGLLHPSSGEHDFRLSGAEARFARPTVDSTRVSIREVEMRWTGLGSRQGFVIVARDEVREPHGEPVRLARGTVGGFADREREERYRGVAARLVALRALSFVACGWTYRIEAEADDVADAELILVAVSILDACDIEVGGA